MALTSNRTSYVAQTPDTVVFDGTSEIPLSRLNASPVDDILVQASGGYLDSRQGFQASWNKFSSTCRSTYQSNIGLSLIAIAGAFMSLMSTLVKMLNNIDPPVPMLEVGLSVACVNRFVKPYQLIFVRMVRASRSMSLPIFRPLTEVDCRQERGCVRLSICR